MDDVVAKRQRQFASGYFFGLGMAVAIAEAEVGEKQAELEMADSDDEGYHVRQLAEAKLALDYLVGRANGQGCFTSGSL